MRILTLSMLVSFFFIVRGQINSAPELAQQLKTASIWKHYQTAKTDSVKIQALISLARAYYNSHDFNNAFLYNNQLRIQSDHLKMSRDTRLALLGIKGKAAYYLCLGDVQKKQSHYQQALKNYFLSFDLFTTLKNQQQCAILLSNIAFTYSEIGNYSESLKYCFRALKSQEELHDEKRVAVELNNIGAIYSDIHQYSKALLYFIKARDMSQAQKDKESIALYTGNIGHGYQLLCDSAFEAGNSKYSLELQNKALSYYFTALKLSEEIADKENVAVCLENIAILYYNIENYKHALPYLLKALGLYQELHLNAEQSYCFNMAGAAYRELGQYKKAETFFKQALHLAKQTGSNYYLMEANLGNSEFYEEIDQPSKALVYYKNYVAYRDSIFNRANTNAITRAELNHEFEKKQAGIKFKNDKVIYQLESENKLYKQWRLFFMIIIILGLVVLFFVKRAYDSKNKLAVLLASEDKRKDMQLEEVHHRINNSLQIISSLLTLQASHAENETLTEYLVQSQNRIQSLSALHELLYDKNAPLNVNMKEYVSKVLGFHRELSKSQERDITIFEDIEAVQLSSKLAVPLALIINELVTNSLKYAFVGRQVGVIKISLARDQQAHLHLMVSDNGKGLPAETNQKKNGLGLKLVHIMTKQIGGKLTSRTDQGVSFNITFAFP